MPSTPDPTRRRLPILAAALLCIAAAAPATKKAPTTPAPAKPGAKASTAPANPGNAGGMTAEQEAFMKAAQGTVDPAQAAGSARWLRGYIASHPNDPAVPMARQLIVRALVTARAPGNLVVAATDTALKAMEGHAMESAVLRAGVARALAERGEQLDKALEYAGKAVADVPATEQLAIVRANCEASLGSVELARGDAPKAIDAFSSALGQLPEDEFVLTPMVLRSLGMAYEKTGKNEEALESYINSLAIFNSSDTSAAAPLRALAKKTNTPQKDVDARLASARETSRHRAVIDGRRFDVPAPEWSLKDLSGKPVKLADYKGKLVVMDFWGSWCGPCRLELPHFQKLYERYSKQGIVFLGMNWEQPGPADKRMKAVRDFLAQNHYSFPVVIDHEAEAAKLYEVNSFPTVFLIDKTGTIRFRNTGYSDGITEIIEEQLKTMMN